MIRTIRKLCVRGIRIVTTHTELLVTLIILLVIPCAFLWTGQQFLDIGTEHSDRLLKDRIGTLHDVLALTLRTSTSSEQFESAIVQLATDNPDIRSLVILNSERGVLYEYGRAETGIPYDDELRVAALRPDESIIFETYSDTGRMWRGVRAVVDSTGVLTHYVLTEVSMAAVDTYRAAKVRNAYGILVLVVGAVLLILMRQLRVINYSRLYSDLKASHDTMTLFVNMTAHELRAPLTAIHGYASMIQEQQYDLTGKTKMVGYAKVIEESSRALLNLINDLLDLAKLQSGTLSFVHEKFDVSEVVFRTTTLLAPLASQSGIGLTQEVPQNTDCTTYGDSTRFGQALTNVVTNALKYTKEGTVTILLTKHTDHYELRVKDTGMGISADDQKRLFAPYFRVSSPEVGKITGTGLGMWITKRMIEEMKGTIDVESIKGVGTHIVITIPILTA